MSERPRDWDKEMADIDKAIAKQGSSPATPASSGGSVYPPARAVPQAQRATRGGVALTWFWVMLGIALGVSLLIWPYDKSCGLSLAFFFGAALTTAVFGLLGAFSAWAHRRGFAHLLSLCCPRVGGCRRHA